MSSNLESYILKVLKKVHPEQKLSSNAKSQINFILFEIAMAIIKEAIFLASGEIYSLKKSPKNKTLNPRDIQSALSIVLGNSELKKHAISEGTKAIIKYYSSYSGYGSGSRSRSAKKTAKQTKAGLLFPVTKIGNIIRQKYKGHVSSSASIYLAGVLEYICAELSELSGNAARENRKVVIRNRDLLVAIENDEELYKLMNKLDIGIL